MAAYSPGSAPAAFNLLAAAKRIWNDVGPEIKASDTLKEGPLLPPEDLKQVCKYLQSTVTKFSASATVVAEAEEAQRSLTPIAEEVIKAYTMLVGTLLRINSGAGYSLSKEVKDAGDNLTEAVNALGMAVCTSSLAPSAGKVLEHVTALEKSSTQNRAAIMRRLLKSLAQLRDANREMAEELEAPDSGNSGQRAEVFSGDEELLEDDDDLSIPPMDPSERTLLENVRCVSEHFEDLVKEASTCCIDQSKGLGLAELEVLAENIEDVSGAIDALAADSVGGTDIEACKSGLERLRKASPILLQHFEKHQLPSALDATEAALLAIE